MGLKGDITGLEVLQFKTPLIPRANSYGGTRKSGVVTSNMGFGASRQRRKYRGNIGEYQAVFLLETPMQIDYFRGFINRNEGRKFICHLSYDRPCVEPYVVQVVSDWDESDITAISMEVSVTLQVYGTRNKCLDEFLAFMYSCLGGDFIDAMLIERQAVKAIPTYESN